MHSSFSCTCRVYAAVSVRCLEAVSAINIRVSLACKNIHFAIFYRAQRFALASCCKLSAFTPELSTFEQERNGSVCSIVCRRNHGGTMGDRKAIIRERC
jgi:hypothetical protein